MSNFENRSPAFEDPTFDEKVEEIIAKDILGLPVSEEERTYMDSWLSDHTEAEEGSNA
jgi:hypothetical protein